MLVCFEELGVFAARKVYQYNIQDFWAVCWVVGMVG